MAISVKNYTNRYLVLAILVIMAIWALLFYALLMDEVYDNVDDGLKNQKIEIIREAFKDPSVITDNKTYGINQFIIREVAPREDLDKNHFSRKLIYMPYDEEDEPYRILSTGFFSKDGKAYELEIRTSTVEEDDFLINLAISLSVLYIVIVLSIIIINHFVLRNAWKPFKQTLRNLSQYRFGESKSFQPVKSQVKEFEELNLQIAKMIDRNEMVFEDQKRFLENASHELQTPLAVSIGKMELLLQDEAFNESQLKKLAEAKQSLHRMVGLNKSLLMLSRIENHQYNQTEKIDFNALTKNLLEELEDIYTYKEVQVSLEDKGIFLADCNPELAQILIGNLLRNAIKYNRPQGQIQVVFSERTIRIANDSLGEALNPKYIFERFHKGTQDSTSNGLGLSIVQSILEKYPHLTIQYQFIHNQHVFELIKN